MPYALSMAHNRRAPPSPPDQASEHHHVPGLAPDCLPNLLPECDGIGSGRGEILRQGHFANRGRGLQTASTPRSAGGRPR